MAETKLYNQVFYYLRDNQYPEGCTKDQKRNLRKYFYFASLTAPKTILPILLNRTFDFRGVQIRERGSISASGFGPGGPNPRGVQIRCDTGRLSLSGWFG